MSVFHLKKFDFGQENLQFPIHLPIARRRFFRVKRTHLQKNTRTEKNMSFAGMTGNQILLTLMDFQYLTQVELVEGFKALSNISQSSKIDWNEHEVVLDCLDKIYEIKDSLSFDSYLDLLIAFDKLDIQDQDMYQLFYQLFPKMNGRLKRDNFGKVYNILMKRGSLTDEEKKAYTEILPRELASMKPLTQVQAFELVVDNELLSEYNWHYHFHLNFWKLGNQLEIEGYARTIKKFIEIDYFDQPEFWNVEYLPGLDIAMQKCEDANLIKQLINVLAQAHKINNSIEVYSYIRKLEERANFVEFKLPMIKSGSFLGMVKKDLQYYEQKERLDLELTAKE